MAGSYEHCTNKDGEFDAENFYGMIENLGDAYEACEMMHYMIDYLSGGREIEIKEASDAYFISVNPSYNPDTDR